MDSTETDRTTGAASELTEGLGTDLTLGKMREDYDWKEAFVYAMTIRTATGCQPDGFGIDDVAEVLKACQGENDGDSWMMAGRLNDGRFFFIDAWCDYTGWDCRAGGDAQVANTLENLVRYGMTEEARDRLGFKVPNVELTGAHDND